MPPAARALLAVLAVLAALAAAPAAGQDTDFIADLQERAYEIGDEVAVDSTMVRSPRMRTVPYKPDEVAVIPPPRSGAAAFAVRRPTLVDLIVQRLRYEMDIYPIFAGVSTIESLRPPQYRAFEWTTVEDPFMQTARDAVVIGNITLPRSLDGIADLRAMQRNRYRHMVTVGRLMVASAKLIVRDDGTVKELHRGMPLMRVANNLELVNTHNTFTVFYRDAGAPGGGDGQPAVNASHGTAAARLIAIDRVEVTTHTDDAHRLVPSNTMMMTMSVEWVRSSADTESAIVRADAIHTSHDSRAFAIVGAVLGGVTVVVLGAVGTFLVARSVANDISAASMLKCEVSRFNRTAQRDIEMQDRLLRESADPARARTAAAADDADDGTASSFDAMARSRTSAIVGSSEEDLLVFDAAAGRRAGAHGGDDDDDDAVSWTTDADGDGTAFVRRPARFPPNPALRVRGLMSVPRLRAVLMALLAIGTTIFATVFVLLCMSVQGWFFVRSPESVLVTVSIVYALAAVAGGCAVGAAIQFIERGTDRRRWKPSGAPLLVSLVLSGALPAAAFFVTLVLLTVINAMPYGVVLFLQLFGVLLGYSLCVVLATFLGTFLSILVLSPLASYACACCVPPLVPAPHGVDRFGFAKEHGWASRRARAWYHAVATAVSVLTSFVQSFSVWSILVSFWDGYYQVAPQWMVINFIVACLVFAQEVYIVAFLRVHLGNNGWHWEPTRAATRSTLLVSAWIFFVFYPVRYKDSPLDSFAAWAPYVVFGFLAVQSVLTAIGFVSAASLQASIVGFSKTYTRGLTEEDHARSVGGRRRAASSDSSESVSLFARAAAARAAAVDDDRHAVACEERVRPGRYAEDPDSRNIEDPDHGSNDEHRLD